MHARFYDHAGSAGTRDVAPARIAFHVLERVGIRDKTISWLHGWPAHSPTDASLTFSRMPAHGSGAMWFAMPSSEWTLTTYALPVSRRTQHGFSRHAAREIFPSKAAAAMGCCVAASTCTFSSSTSVAITCRYAT